MDSLWTTPGSTAVGLWTTQQPTISTYTPTCNPTLTSTSSTKSPSNIPSKTPSSLPGIHLQMHHQMIKQPRSDYMSIFFKKCCKMFVDNA